MSTLLYSASACRPSWPDAADTLSASARDWSADWLAPVTLIETSLVPVAACWTLRAISRVAESCCFHGGGNGGGDAADFADGVADAADRRHAVAGGGLDRGDLSCDFFGCLRGLAGELLDLGCDDGKSAAGLAGARGLDGRVQRQQVGLACDRADQAKHVADLLGGRGQAAHHLGGLSGLDHGAFGDLAGMGDLPADLGDGGSQFFGRGGNRVDAAGCLVGRGRRSGGPLRSAVHAGRDLAGHALHVGCCLCDRGDDALDVGLEAVGHLALQGLLLEFGLLLGGLLRLAHAARLDHAAAEHVDRAGHGAEFVAALAAGDRDVDLAAGKAVHDRGNGGQWARQAATEQERQHDRAGQDGDRAEDQVAL